MKRISFLLLVIIGTFLLASCQKPEGDDVPNMGKKLSYSIDTAGVFSLTSTSESGMVVDLLKLYYTKDQAQTVIHKNEVDSIVRESVLVKKSAPFRDTIWTLEPNTAYKYYVDVRDFASETLADTIADTLLVWLPVRTMDPGRPKVSADSAKMVGDTLWLYGTVKSHWRALTNSNGIGGDMCFYYGDSESSVDNRVEAVTVNDTVIGGDLKINIKGFIPSTGLQDLDTVWYKVYAKHVWGDGEKLSAGKEMPL